MAAKKGDQWAAMVKPRDIESACSEVSARRADRRSPTMVIADRLITAPNRWTPNRVRQSARRPPGRDSSVAVSGWATRRRKLTAASIASSDWLPLTAASRRGSPPACQDQAMPTSPSRPIATTCSLSVGATRENSIRPAVQAARPAHRRGIPAPRPWATDSRTMASSSQPATWVSRLRCGVFAAVNGVVPAGRGNAADALPPCAGYFCAARRSAPVGRKTAQHNTCPPSLPEAAAPVTISAAFRIIRLAKKPRPLPEML